MSYLHHIIACNRFDPARYVPLLYRDVTIGAVLRENIPALDVYRDLISCSHQAISIKPAKDDRQQLNWRFEALVRDLVSRRLLRQFRDEPFAVSERWGTQVFFDLDRGAVALFGTRAYGVHVNGYRRRGDSFDLWIGRRSPTKSVAPDKLDNIIGGGIAAGHGVRETLVKEAGEEASMSPDLARQARSTGAIAYRMSQEGGMRNDVLFVFDLEVPADFVPVGNDGEIVRYDLIPIEECLRLVRDTDDFKFNVNLVLIDFAIRHGIIGPEDPEYLQLLAGLRLGFHSKSSTDSDIIG